MIHRPRARTTIPLVPVLLGLACWLVFAFAIFAAAGS